MLRFLFRAAACLSCGLLAVLAVPAAGLIAGNVLLWRANGFFLPGAGL